MKAPASYSRPDGGSRPPGAFVRLTVPDVDLAAAAAGPAASLGLAELNDWPGVAFRGEWRPRWRKPVRVAVEPPGWPMVQLNTETSATGVFVRGADPERLARAVEAGTLPPPAWSIEHGDGSAFACWAIHPPVHTWPGAARGPRELHWLAVDHATEATGGDHAYTAELAPNPHHWALQPGVAVRWGDTTGTGPGLDRWRSDFVPRSHWVPGGIRRDKRPPSRLQLTLPGILDRIPRSARYVTERRERGRKGGRVRAAQGLQIAQEAGRAAQAVKAAERRERVRLATAQGWSASYIARAEGVSVSTVRRDRRAGGVTGRTGRPKKRVSSVSRG